MLQCKENESTGTKRPCIKTGQGCRIALINHKW